jgi:hypothetical protein
MPNFWFEILDLWGIPKLVADSHALSTATWHEHHSRRHSINWGTVVMPYKASFYAAAVLGIAMAASCETRAQVSDPRVAALKAITDTANEICDTFKTDGTSSGDKVAGEVKGQLRGLAKILVGLGFGAQGDYNTDRYSGYIRSDLPSVSEGIRKCNSHVFDRLVDLMLPNQTNPVKLEKPLCKTVDRSGPIETTNWLITKNPTLHLDVGDGEQILQAYVVPQNEINAAVSVRGCYEPGTGIV